MKHEDNTSSALCSSFEWLIILRLLATFTADPHRLSKSHSTLNYSSLLPLSSCIFSLGLISPLRGIYPSLVADLEPLESQL